MYSAMAPGDFYTSHTGGIPSNSKDVTNFGRASSELIEYWKQRMITVGRYINILGYFYKGHING